MSRAKAGRALVLTADEAYQPAACVCLTSAFLASADVEFTTYLVTDAPNAALTQAVDRLRGTFGRDIRVAAVDPKSVRQLAASLGSVALPIHVSIVSFLRLMIPALLPVDSFLYLDCDMVVQDSLRPLLEMDLGDNLIAAVRDQASEPANRARVGFRPDEPYFNAGTLVVNARGWRDGGAMARIVAIARESGGRFTFGDQDLINAFCRGRAHALGRRWNTMQHEFFFFGWEGFDPAAFRGIFHFTSEVKPWMSWAPEPSRRLYGRYAPVSPLRMAEVTEPRDDRDRRGLKLLAESAQWRDARGRPA